MSNVRGLFGLFRLENNTFMLYGSIRALCNKQHRSDVIKIETQHNIFKGRHRTVPGVTLPFTQPLIKTIHEDNS